MLLRDVQMVLRTLIVFRDTYPEASRLWGIMEEEFNAHVDLYVERESQSTNMFCIQRTCMMLIDAVLERRPELTRGIRDLVSAPTISNGERPLEHSTIAAVDERDVVCSYRHEARCSRNRQDILYQ